MMYIVQAFKIALLVTVGLLVVVNAPTVSKIVKGEYKKMNKEMVAGKVLKWSGGFGGMLGLAFFFGAFQAYVQGFITQNHPFGSCRCYLSDCKYDLLYYGNKKNKKSRIVEQHTSLTNKGQSHIWEKQELLPQIWRQS